MKDVIKVLGWFNPDVTVEAIKRSVVVHSNQKLLNCFEVFNPDLTVDQLKGIVKVIQAMNFGSKETKTTKKKKETHPKITKEMLDIIKKEHGKKKPREIAETIRKRTGVNVHPDKISQRAWYMKHTGEIKK